MVPASQVYTHMSRKQVYTHVSRKTGLLEERTAGQKFNSRDGHEVREKSWRGSPSPLNVTKKQLFEERLREK